MRVWNEGGAGFISMYLLYKAPGAALERSLGERRQRTVADLAGGAGADWSAG